MLSDTAGKDQLLRRLSRDLQRRMTANVVKIQVSDTGGFSDD